MFLMVRILLLVGFGFFLGLNYKDGQLQRACTAMSGAWNGTICTSTGGT